MNSRIEDIFEDSVIGVASFSDEGLAETISVDDVSVEMHGLKARFLTSFAGTRSNGSAVRFAVGAEKTITDWQGTNELATIDGVNVPKVIPEPAPEANAAVRRYNLNLAGQRRAVERNRAQLTGRLAAAERRRLEGLLARRQATYSRMWVRQMMYNRFDADIARWTAHYNSLLSPATPLDPNVPKSIFFQESRLGTSGQHLMPPPSDWADSDRHPVRSRFNIGQAIDSWGPQQWLMIREMAPSIFTAEGLDAFIARRAWYGMTNEQYGGHAGFMRAFRRFFEARTGGNNLMGTPGRDLHEDYGFWIRTAIRWLFIKYQARRERTWAQAVRGYNGGGASAEQYSREVMARVGDISAYTASEASEAVPDEMHRSPAWAAPRTSDMDEQELTESSPRLDSNASLSWQNQTLMRNSRGVEQLFYVVTGAPPSVARAGDESHAVFELRVRNSNSVYNHQDVVTKARLLQVLRGRRFATAYPDPASGSGWSARRQPDLEDESSRIIPVRFPRDALMRAYDADYPMARVEIEYHWRESGESRQRHYNRTGQDFVLVAPVEFMLGSKTVIRELRLDSPTRHKNDYWIPVSGVNFGPSIREPITVSYAVRTELSRGQDRSDSQSRRRGTTTTNTHTTSNTFSAQLSTGASQESSAQASVEILEVGVKRMFQMGATLGYSRTTTDTRSSAVAEEFANSITLSSSYRSSQSTNAQATLRISPPATSGPTSSRGGSPSGSSSIGVYLYPIVVFYDVPYVRFSGINRHGQATRRSEDRVAVPFIREWRLVAD